MFQNQSWFLQPLKNQLEVPQPPLLPPLVFLRLLLLRDVQALRVRQVVHRDGQEHVEEDVVAADEQRDEVDGQQQAVGLGPPVRVDAVVHDQVPVLARQYLRGGSDLFSNSFVRERLLQRGRGLQ